MASALCENVEDWRLNRQQENFEEHYNGISELKIEEHSSGKNEDAETENHCNVIYGIHDESVNEEDNHSNGEPEENREKIGREEEENISQSTPFYGRTLVAPEYTSFQVQDAASEKENDSEVKNEKKSVLASGSDDYGNDRPEEVKTSHYIDQFKLEDGIDCFREDSEEKFGTSLRVEVEDEEGSRKLVQLVEEDEKEKVGDNEDSANLDREIEGKGDEDAVYKEERPSYDDEVIAVNEVYGQDAEKTKEDIKEYRTNLDLLNELNNDEGEVDKNERLIENDEVQKCYGEYGEYGEEEKDETEDEKVNEENGDRTDSRKSEENERKRDEDFVYRVELTRNDDQEEGYGKKERENEKTEDIVEVEEQHEGHNKVDECNAEKEETEEKNDCREEKTNKEDAGSGEENDEIGEDSGDTQIHHEHTIIQDEEAEEQIPDDAVAIDRFTRLEHCDSLRVNVASPTRDITDVSSAESLNDMDAVHAEGNDADEGEEKLTLEQHEKPGVTINESIKFNGEQQNEDDADEIRSEDESSNSCDSVEDINEPCRDEPKGGDKRGKEHEDLETVPVEEDAKNERKMDKEDTFTVFQNPLVHKDEADLTGNVKKLGMIFEGGGPVFPKATKKELDTADGSPVSVRKFKSIFETHQHSTERTLEQGRRGELSSPPCGIVKNLRGLFENSQSFETRNGKNE